MFPSNKSRKEKLYIAQIEEIKLATEKWAYKNMDMLPNDEGKVVEEVNNLLLELPDFLGYFLLLSNQSYMVKKEVLQLCFLR